MHVLVKIHLTESKTIQACFLTYNHMLALAMCITYSTIHVYTAGMGLISVVSILL